MGLPSFKSTSALYMTPTKASMQELTIQEHKEKLYKTCCYGPLARYVKLRIAHAPGMSRTFSPPPRVSDPDMHHDTCVTHVS